MTLSLNKLWLDTQAVMDARLRDFFLPAAAFMFLPNFAVTLFFPSLAVGADVPPAAAFAAIVAFLISLIGTVAVIRLAASPAATVAGAIREGAARLLPAILFSIVAGLIITAGLFALIIPGLIAIAALFAGLPVLVLEGRSPIDVIKRSWQLSKSHLGRLLLLILFLFGAVLFLSIAAGAVGLLDALLSGESGDFNLFTALASGVLSAAVGTYVATMQAQLLLHLAGPEDRSIVA